MLGLLTAAPLHALPEISLQPDPLSLRAGDDAFFEVVAEGVDLSFQWYMGDRGDTSQAVPGANGALLVTPPIQTNTRYWVRVTDAEGSVDSLAVDAIITSEPDLKLDLWGTGQQDFGSLGTGFAGYSSTPVQLQEAVAGLAVNFNASVLFVLGVDGTLRAFGDNTYGQLGLGDTTDRTVLETVATSVRAVETSGSTTFFIKNDDTLWAMGRNFAGQLGDGTTADRHSPVQIASGVASVVADSQTTFFLKTDDTLWGMGDNVSGVFGNGTTEDSSAPVSIAENVAAIVAGSTRGRLVYLKTDRSLWGIGQAASGEFGLDPSIHGINHTSAVQIATDVEEAFVLNGAILYRTTGNDLYGLGRHADLGTGLEGETFTPTSLAGGVTDLAASKADYAFLGAGGSLWSTFESETLVEIGAGFDSILLASPEGLYLGDAEGAVWAVGNNHWGQLASDDFGESITAPVETHFEQAPIDGFTGGSATYYLGADGTLYGAGNDQFLAPWGLQPEAATIDPVLVAEDVVFATTYAYSTLFIDSGGSLWGLGRNLYGQLGLGDRQPRITPVKIADDVVSASLGLRTGYYVTRDGTLWGMGSNLFGYLGDGTEVDRLSPVAIDTGVVSVASGPQVTLFLKANGTLWGFGQNITRQLGDRGSDVTAPVFIVDGVIEYSTSGSHSMYVQTNVHADGATLGRRFFTLGGLGENFSGAVGTSTGFEVTGDGSNIDVPTLADNDAVRVQTGYLRGWGDYTLIERESGDLFGIGGPVGRIIAPWLARDLFTGEDIVDFTGTHMVDADGNLFEFYFDGFISKFERDTSVYALGQGNDATNTLWLRRAARAVPTLDSVEGPTEAESGELLVFTASASGGDLTYEWFEGSAGDESLLLASGKARTFLVSAPQAGSHQYWVRVSNALGTVSSDTIVVSVLPAPATALQGVGDGSDGRLGDSAAATNTTPLDLADNVASVAAGDRHSLFVDHLGDAYTLGANDFGQLGSGTTDPSTVPQLIASDIAAVAAGDAHSFLLDASGQLFGMGYNFGTFGDASEGDLLLPTLVQTGIAKVAGGGAHSAFLTPGGDLYVTGDNFFGQAGRGGWADSSAIPRKVASSVRDVSAGRNHTVFVTTDGILWGLGDNQFHQLGASEHAAFFRPRAIASGVVAVAAGADHTLFLNVDGSLWAMGKNDAGQASGGAEAAENGPLMVATGVRSIAAGGAHSLFIRNDFSLWGFGANESGQLARIDPGPAFTPVELLDSVYDVVAGTRHTLLRRVINGLAPSLLGAPHIPAVERGTSGTLAIELQGIFPITMQWYAGLSGDLSSPIAGATGTSLETGILTSESHFWVRLDNAYGTFDSPTLTVVPFVDPPSIASLSPDQSVAYGESTLLTVVAAGTEPFFYQWYLGAPGDTSAPLTGGTSATLALASVTENRDYWVRVSNDAGQVDSLAVTISFLLDPPSVVPFSYDTVVDHGKPTELKVSASSPAPITFQWYRGTPGDVSQPLAGATAANLTTPPIVANTSFWVRTTNAGGHTDTGPFEITVNIPRPAILATTSDLVVPHLSSAEFAVTGDGVPPLTYQWYRGFAGDTSDPIEGASAAALQIASASSPAAYWVRLMNAGGSVDSRTFSLQVRPAIVNLPTEVSVPLGDPIQLSVEATDAVASLSYVWYQGETGDPSNLLAFTKDLNLTHYGADELTVPVLKFWVRVTGNLTTASETITVNLTGEPPVITAQPEDVFAQYNTADLKWRADSSTAIDEQWYFGESGDTSTPVSSDYSPLLRLARPTAIERYWVRLTNLFGSTDSRTATVYPTRTYAEWTGHHALTGLDALPTADPDHDHYINRVEFLLGTSPTTPMTPDERPVFGYTAEEGTLYLTLSYRRSLLARTVFPDTLYPQILISGDLSIWSDYPSSIIPEIDPDPPTEEATYEWMKVRIPTYPEAHPKGAHLYLDVIVGP